MFCITLLTFPALLVYKQLRSFLLWVLLYIRAEDWWRHVTLKWGLSDAPPLWLAATIANAHQLHLRAKKDVAPETASLHLNVHFPHTRRAWRKKKENSNKCSTFIFTSGGGICQLVSDASMLSLTQRAVFTTASDADVANSKRRGSHDRWAGNKMRRLTSRTYE